MFSVVEKYMKELGWDCAIAAGITCIIKALYAGGKKMDTMIELHKIFFDILFDDAFGKFQNKVAETMYESIASSYEKDANEVSMVTDFCEKLNGLDAYVSTKTKTKTSMKFHYQKIHGKKSYVDFFMPGKDKCGKELGDTVIISVITKDLVPKYYKIAIVQNKKETKTCSCSWEIDLEQLFLLKNFPAFTGQDGSCIKKIFKDEKVVFHNLTGSLGIFGLFKKPAEFVAATAEEVNSCKKKDPLRFDDLKANARVSPCLPPKPSIGIGDTTVIMLCNNGIAVSTPCLLPNSLSLDVHEFVKNLTQFNIGEPVYPEKDTSQLSLFILNLLNSSGIAKGANIKLPLDEESTGDIEFNILCVHLNYDESKNESR
jgi:hypothetical protein